MAKIFTLFTFLLLIIATGLQAQELAWFIPASGGPNVDVNQEITIYVDVSHPDCECPLLIDAEDSLYIWTWEPSENATVNNGQWNASNPELQMTNEGANIWSYTMVPTTFYNVDASVVYDIGISFLVKKFDGSTTAEGEPKSVDIHLDIPMIINSVEENDSNTKDIKLYPNPSNSIFEMTLPQNFKEGTVEIYSSEGRLIYSERIGTTQTTWTWRPNSSVEQGLYFLKLYTANTSFSNKLIFTKNR
jgi:hypothetical protein